MLSWLLNPNENHGFGDRIIRGFVQYVVAAFPNKVNVFETLLMDCYSFTIMREWHSIDILAVSSDEKCVLCIENKIDSTEHDNQLNRYRRIIEDTYPNYSKLFIYLSPNCDEASDSDTWCSMGYQEVLNIIESAHQKVKLLPDAELLISNYVNTIRRDIVGDERLAQICADIYAKHQKALDLIYENRPDRAADIAAIFRAWAIAKTEQGEIEFVPEKSNKTYTRFKTKGMSEILPDSAHPLSGWGTTNYYFYEIRNTDGREFWIQLALSSKDIPEDMKLTCENINTYYPSRQQKTNWLWRTPFSTRHTKLEEELSEEKIFEQLDKKLSEVKAFEADLKTKLCL